MILASPLLQDPVLRALFQEMSGTVHLAWAEFASEAVRFELGTPEPVPFDEGNFPADKPPDLVPYLDLVVQMPDIFPGPPINDARIETTPPYDVLDGLNQPAEPLTPGPLPDGTGATASAAPHAPAVVLLHDGLTLIL